MRIKVLAGCCVAVLVVGAVAMGPGVIDERKATPEPVVQKLGGYELPYTGDGSIEYDLVQSTWTIAFKAPEGWPCTHLGYAFKTEQRDIPVDHETRGTLDLRDLLSSGMLWVHGKLELTQDGDTLLATVETEDAVYDFEFVVDGDLPVETLEPRAEKGDARGDCPEGTDEMCECYGEHGCKACCKLPRRPSCHCARPASCICVEDSKKSMFESAKVGVDPIDP